MSGVLLTLKTPLVLTMKLPYDFTALSRNLISLIGGNPVTVEEARHEGWLRGIEAAAKVARDEIELSVAAFDEKYGAEISLEDAIRALSSPPVDEQDG